MCRLSQDNPKVSVIVPVYNVRAYLRECLDSLKNQTYTNLEILLVDDGSTDGSGKICDEYAAIDSRFKVFHIQNKGLSAARNLGLSFASGEFIGFVDSDDKCALTMFESLLGAALKFHADITFGAKSCWYSTGIYQEKHPNEDDMLVTKKEFMEAVFSQNRWKFTSVAGGYVWLKLFRHQTIQDLKFVEDNKYLEDELFCVSACIKSNNICCIKDILVLYRQRQNSLIRADAFLFRLLEGRIRIDSLPKDKSLMETCQIAVIEPLGLIAKCSESNFRGDKSLLLHEAAMKYLPVVKKHGNFEIVFYTWMLTKPQWLRSFFFLIRRFFVNREQLQIISKDLFA